MTLFNKGDKVLLPQWLGDNVIAVVNANYDNAADQWVPLSPEYSGGAAVKVHESQLKLVTRALPEEPPNSTIVIGYNKNRDERVAIKRVDGTASPYHWYITGASYGKSWEVINNGYGPLYEAIGGYLIK